MTRKLIKNVDLEKISGGNLKKVNRALDYTSAGIEAAAGILVSYLILDGDNLKEKIRNININIHNLLPLALTAHGIWRIISRACDLYNGNKNKSKL